MLIVTTVVILRTADHVERGGLNNYQEVKKVELIARRM